ncbi:MAG: hypothetical protein CMH64_04255 [Nanoarchaeota archaeon]|nr:hypothetical protein [Nanoarchaeota archaeon]|tara:strand:+ start:1476 stop:1946 length:471 start_codon:yes stop_codon:yes gene_type:complete
MKPQNIIIASVFLLVISFFSFSFESITGNPIKVIAPEMTIVKDNVRAGQPIQIRVKINEGCIDPKITFHSDEGIRKDTRIYKPSEDDCANQNFHSCKGSKYCKGDLKGDLAIYDYYTLPSWKVNPGVYTVRMHYIERVGQAQKDTPYIERPFRINS